MITKRLLPALRFLTGTALAPLQLWVLWGVCGSCTVLIHRVINSELSLTSVLPDLARASVLTGLFLVLVGMLWSWATKSEGLQAAAWFAVLAATATLSPLLISSQLSGPAESLQLELPIRIGLAVVVAAALYLGSHMLRAVRGHLAPAR
jgi:hypothetical protein